MQRILIIIISLSGFQIYSQNPDSTKTKNEFAFSGYFDVYYTFNLNNPASRNNLGNSGVCRLFDKYSGAFQVGMLLTRFSYTTKKTKMVAEVGFGPNIDYARYGSSYSHKWGTVIANSTYGALMIKQAYIEYTPIKKLTFTIGQFGTPIGFEVLDTPLNINYSINNTCNSGTPFYHLGIKATYKFNDKIRLMSGLVNGADEINDNNRGKSYIGQLVVSPTSKLNIYFNTIQGNEGNANNLGQNVKAYFGVLDLIIQYQMNNKLLLCGWFVLGTAKGDVQGMVIGPELKNWSGTILYAKYNFLDKLALGTRLEYFNNNSGARALLTDGKGTSVIDYTLTGIISLANGNLQLKPEFRIDIFNREKNGTIQQFEDSSGNFSKNKQSTIGLAAIYVFKVN